MRPRSSDDATLKSELLSDQCMISVRGPDELLVEPRKAQRGSEMRRVHAKPLGKGELVGNPFSGSGRRSPAAACGAVGDEPRATSHEASIKAFLRLTNLSERAWKRCEQVDLKEQHPARARARASLSGL